MKNNVTHIERIEASRAQQLTLLSVPESTPNATPFKSSSAHARFQLSATARARGLEHVAEIRRQLAKSLESKESNRVRKLPPRTHQAA
jgi:hypothetical protein